MTLAVRADRRPRARHNPQHRVPPALPGNQAPASPIKVAEPMELGSMSPQEHKEYRLKHLLCLYCGDPGHRVATSHKRQPLENFRS
ncbi:hypothetical protein GDO78_015265 [Eleutherodactylus coqui]|uniref:Uncharacterized protein n=1 Tax=Eleutherodactylus coqui TaxID=57060 RepID=A0A8J6B783_ELECQ|nr:hypothetical protein GDO78_015265 [Eleutherodactylus coqui]